MIGIACLASYAAVILALIFRAPKYWWLDPRALLSSIGFLYLGSIPVLHMLGIPISVSDPTRIGCACILQNAGWAAGILLVPPRNDILVLKFLFFIRDRDLILRPLGMNYNLGAAIFAIAVATFLGIAISRGLLSGEFLVRDNRAVDFYTQDRLVLSMLCVGMFIALVRSWRMLGRGSRATVAAASLLYIYVLLSIGSRREIVQLAVPAMIAIILRSKSPLVLASSTAASALAVMLCLGWYREGIHSRNDVGPEALAANIEFVMPPVTFDYYSASSRPPFLGLTIISAPLMLLPRKIFPWKPDDLGVQFVIDYTGTRDGMGYAFLPATELYLNFGYLGVIGGFMAFSVSLGYLFRRPPTGEAKAGIMLIVFAYAFDFNRGSIPTIIYQSIFSLAGYCIIWMSVQPTIGEKAAVRIA